jgi:hypothetical protein
MQEQAAAQRKLLGLEQRQSAGSPLRAIGKRRLPECDDADVAQDGAAAGIVALTWQ